MMTVHQELRCYRQLTINSSLHSPFFIIPAVRGFPRTVTFHQDAVLMCCWRLERQCSLNSNASRSDRTLCRE